MLQSLPKKIVIKIYLDNTDTYKNEPLWRYILEKLQVAKIAGATVYKAVAGIGEHSTLHTFEILNLSNEMPLIIEIIDEEKKLISFLQQEREALKNLFITKDSVEVLSFLDNGE